MAGEQLGHNINVKASEGELRPHRSQIPQKKQLKGLSGRSRSEKTDLRGGQKKQWSPQRA